MLLGAAQTEKQRIIWAYKILFLDVLFPLSLRKVIFADSDQISRADFAELWNLDMQAWFCTLAELSLQHHCVTVGSALACMYLGMQTARL